MERKLVEVENHLSLLVLAIAINPTLRANTVKDTNMGQYTRSVMCKVPAVLLLVLGAVLGAVLLPVLRQCYC